ncbi:MAG: hypothetical protein VB939_11285 [Pseudomonadales bacterium]|nr:hypothetical protein [Pseudomonadales bacterium]
MSLSSAWSISRLVNPPRMVYLDFPLGHTAGRAHDVQSQKAVVMAALRLLEEARDPGSATTLSQRWSTDDAWKDAVMRPKIKAGRDGAFDDRVERFATPQYQESEDADLVTGDCSTCVWLEA